MGKKPMVIAINAVSGGGKTAITNALCRIFENSRALYFDHYEEADKNIPDVAKWIEDGADYDLWHLENMADDIAKILSTNQNIEYIILDYPFGYKQKQLAEFINLSVYIDTPLDIALARRIIRDISTQTRVDEVVNLLTSYLRSRNTYLYSQICHKDSDFRVDGNLPIDEIADIIAYKIRKHSRQ
jgi:uridine kinase